VDRLATAAAPRAQDQGATKARRQIRERAVQMRVASIRLGPCVRVAGWLESVCVCGAPQRPGCRVRSARAATSIVRMGTLDRIETVPVPGRKQRRHARSRDAQQARDQRRDTTATSKGAKDTDEQQQARRERARGARKEGNRVAARVANGEAETREGGRESHTSFVGEGRSTEKDGTICVRGSHVCLRWKVCTPERPVATNSNTPPRGARHAPRTKGGRKGRARKGARFVLPADGRCMGGEENWVVAGPEPAEV
jgi:hypothetical protein